MCDSRNFAPSVCRKGREVTANQKPCRPVDSPANCIQPCKGATQYQRRKYQEISVSLRTPSNFLALAIIVPVGRCGFNRFRSALDPKLFAYTMC